MTMMSNNDASVKPAAITQKKKRLSFISRLYEKYADYVDAVLFIVSIWATLVIFGMYGDQLPEPDWPFHLDELLWFILLFMLCLITSSLLRGVLMIAIAAGLLWGLSFLAIDLYEDMRDPRITKKTISVETDGSIGTMLQGLFHYNTPVPDSSLQQLQQQVKLLQEKVDSLEKHTMQKIEIKAKQPKSSE